MGNYSLWSRGCVCILPGSSNQMYFPFGLSQSVNEHESFVWDSQKSLRSSPLPVCAQGFLQMKLCVQFLMVSLLTEYLWHAGDLPLVEQKDGSCHQRHYTRNFCGHCRAFFFFSYNKYSYWFAFTSSGEMWKSSSGKWEEVNWFCWTIHIWRYSDLWMSSWLFYEWFLHS